MNLYIQVEDGQCVNHPALEENLLDALGEIPSNWEPFIRVVKPRIYPEEYKILLNQESIYGKVGGIWTDIWNIRDMTEEEKTTSQEDFVEEWREVFDQLNYSAWVFDPITFTMQPPVPNPGGDNKAEQRKYYWHGPSNQWFLRPVYPVDDGGIIHIFKEYEQAWVPFE